MKNQTLFDKICKEFNFGVNYTIDEKGERKIIWYFGPLSVSYNITKWEESFWNIFNFKNSEKKQ